MMELMEFLATIMKCMFGGEMYVWAAFHKKTSFQLFNIEGDLLYFGDVWQPMAQKTLHS